MRMTSKSNYPGLPRVKRSAAAQTACLRVGRVGAMIASIEGQLLGANRKSSTHPQNDASDPVPTLAEAFRCGAQRPVCPKMC
jgi:hypothetical protein